MGPNPTGPAYQLLRGYSHMITVLRLGHRKKRDPRISTHVGLVARAFGADRIIYAGEEDPELVKRLNRISQKWGGTFRASYTKDWEKTIGGLKRRGNYVVHLTMYGADLKLELADLQKQYRRKKGMVIVVGAEKVPAEMYELADVNVSVTQQPHSEVAALAVFLRDLFGGKERVGRFLGAELKIVPQRKGKRVLRGQK